MPNGGSRPAAHGIRGRETGEFFLHHRQRGQSRAPQSPHHIGGLQGERPVVLVGQLPFQSRQCEVHTADPCQSLCHGDPHSTGRILQLSSQKSFRRLRILSQHCEALSPPPADGLVRVVQSTPEYGQIGDLSRGSHDGQIVNPFQGVSSKLSGGIVALQRRALGQEPVVSDFESVSFQRLAHPRNH